MGHSARNGLLWVSLILICLFAVAGYFVLSPERPIMTTPSSVTVDATSLPATAKVNGTQITLSRIERMGDDRMQLEISVLDPHHRISLEQFSSLVEGKDIPNLGVGGSDQGTKTELSADFPLPKGHNKLDFSCAIQSKLLSSLKKVSFANLSPKHLPVSQKIGPITVTVEKAYYGNTTYPSWGEKAKYFVIVYSVTGPPDNFRGKFTLLKDGQEWNRDAADPYWLIHDSNSVTDENGKALHSNGAMWNEKSAAYDVFDKETNKLTLTESLISKVNRRKASVMVTNRATKAAIQSTRTFGTTLYIDSGRLPDHFNFSTTICTQPSARKRCRAIFTNVAIPPK